jgi:ABC-type lipoprotein export system ATPase subunit
VQAQLRLVIEPGTDKRGQAEPVRDLAMQAGEVIAVVGPTGSGKTRLLADVERLADGDSPTARRVRLLGAEAESEDPRTLVARISQSMSFFLDATVEELLAMHCAYRNRGADTEPTIDAVVDWANRLCGEGFARQTVLAQLSGGQARALMITDTVLVSRCPVVLIDEIENAGIERSLALELLLRSQTIAVLATHDPLIALQAERRIVMANGAMVRVVERSPAEAELLRALADQQLEREKLQQRLRAGKSLAG